MIQFFKQVGTVTVFEAAHTQINCFLYGINTLNADAFTVLRVTTKDKIHWPPENFLFFLGQSSFLFFSAAVFRLYSKNPIYAPIF